MDVHVVTYTIREAVESIMRIMELDPGITTQQVSDYFAYRGLVVSREEVEKMISEIKNEQKLRSL